MSKDFIPKPNTGSIFPNSRKERPEHPDMTGNIYLARDLLEERMANTPEGELVHISVSAWNNANDRIGMTFKKPYVKPVDKKTQAAEPKSEPEREPEPVDDDDIPF